MKEVSLGNNWIKKIENLPPNLKYLFLDSNYINSIENLPKSIEIFDISDNLIPESEVEKFYEKHPDIRTEGWVKKIILFFKIF